MLLTLPGQGKGSELHGWQVEALQSIDRSSSRLVELTEDLLDVTRLQGGGLELHPEPTDLVALTQRVVNGSRSRLHSIPLPSRPHCRTWWCMSMPGASIRFSPT